MKFEQDKITLKNGEIRYTLKWYGSGRDRASGNKSFRSAAARKAWLENLLETPGALKRKTKAPPAAPAFIHTMAEGVAYYRCMKYPSLSPGTRRNFDGFWDELVLIHKMQPRAADQDSWPELRGIAQCPIVDFRKPLLREIERRLKYQGNSQKTVNNKTGFIRTLLRYLEEEEKIELSPIGKFKVAKPPQPQMRFWERDDGEDFLAYADARYPRGHKNRWIYVVYLVGLNCGLRAGEIWALKPACIKRESKQLYISERLDSTDKQFYPPKGKGPRYVPLQDHVLEELEFLMEQKRIGRFDLFFVTDVKTPIDHKNFSDDKFKPDLLKWKGPWLNFHGLRHTAGTNMVAGGIDIKTVQLIFGHKNIATTMRYLHNVSGKIRHVSETYAIRPNGRQNRLTVIK